jgi:hypothetical protein
MARAAAVVARCKVYGGHRPSRNAFNDTEREYRPVSSRSSASVAREMFRRVFSGSLCRPSDDLSTETKSQA